MRTLDGVLDEFCAALQFPWYFGHNRDAFDECIRELDWLGTFDSLTVVIYDGDAILADDAHFREWFATAIPAAATGNGRHPARIEVVIQVPR